MGTASRKPNRGTPTSCSMQMVIGRKNKMDSNLLLAYGKNFKKYGYFL